MGRTICEFCGRRQSGDLFEVVRAQAHRSSDPDTSRQAALQNEPRRGGQRARVLDAIRQSGYSGLTAREAESASGVERAGRRVSELKQGGHIVAAGTRVDPRTHATAEVFVATRLVALVKPRPTPERHQDRPELPARELPDPSEYADLEPRRR